MLTASANALVCTSFAVLYHASDMIDCRYLQGLARRVRDGGKLAAITVIGAVVLTLWLAFSSDPAHVSTEALEPPPTAEQTPTAEISRQLQERRAFFSRRSEKPISASRAPMATSA